MILRIYIGLAADMSYVHDVDVDPVPLLRMTRMIEWLCAYEVAECCSDRIIFYPVGPDHSEAGEEYELAINLGELKQSERNPVLRGAQLLLQRLFDLEVIDEATLAELTFAVQQPHALTLQ